MFRCILMKRIVKNLKTRYQCSKYERTPSSLHEFLEGPVPKTRPWPGWFPILLAVPLTYYMLVSRKGDAFQRIISANTPQSDQERESFMSIPVRLSSAVFLLHNDTQKASLLQSATSLPAEDWLKSSYLDNETLVPFTIHGSKKARVPSRYVRKNIYSFDNRQKKKSRPYCKSERLFEDKSPETKLQSQDNARTGRYIFDQYSLKMVLKYRHLLYKGGYYESPTCKSRHRIAIIVPYRDCETNLAVFLYVMHPFLIEQGLEYRVFVVEQSGKDPFNRGRLLNVGFQEAMKQGKWGCVVFHDVNLLPTTDKIKYTCPTWPRHMCGAVIGKQESDKNKNYFGGVTVMSPKHFTAVNGYSNSYWGFGGEDTVMFWRIKHIGLALTRYSKAVAIYKALPHKQNPDKQSSFRNLLLKTSKERIKTDGLLNCHYKIIFQNMYHTYTHILVDINPDKENITAFHM